MTVGRPAFQGFKKRLRLDLVFLFLAGLSILNGCNNSLSGDYNNPPAMLEALRVAGACTAQIKPQPDQNGILSNFPTNKKIEIPFPVALEANAAMTGEFKLWVFDSMAVQGGSGENGGSVSQLPINAVVSQTREYVEGCVPRGQLATIVRIGPKAIGGTWPPATRLALSYNWTPQGMESGTNAQGSQNEIILANTHVFTTAPRTDSNSLKFSNQTPGTEIIRPDSTILNVLLQSSAASGSTKIRLHTSSAITHPIVERAPNSFAEELTDTIDGRRDIPIKEFPGLAIGVVQLNAASLASYFANLQTTLNQLQYNGTKEGLGGWTNRWNSFVNSNFYNRVDAVVRTTDRRHTIEIECIPPRGQNGCFPVTQNTVDLKAIVVVHGGGIQSINGDEAGEVYPVYVGAYLITDFNLSLGGSKTGIQASSVQLGMEAFKP